MSYDDVVGLFRGGRGEAAAVFLDEGASITWAMTRINACCAESCAAVVSDHVAVGWKTAGPMKGRVLCRSVLVLSKRCAEFGGAARDANASLTYH